jgi:Tfp pilus assembly protein PilO
VNKRELILAAGLGAIAAAYGGHWIYQTSYATPLAERYEETNRLREDIEKRKLDLARFQKASKELKRWQTQSLPSDTEVARSLYQAWLVGLVSSAGFSNPNVDSSEPVTRRGMYDSLTFSVRSRGTLKQLTKFLFDFYRADHLHQIQSLNLTPVPRLEELEIVLSIEALSLPQADRKKQLSASVSDRLASDQLAEYRAIAERNLFGVGGNAADEADFAYLTAVIEVNGEPEAWFTLRASGKLLKLRRQQSFEIGQFKGTIAEIHGSEVVLLCDDERWLISVGESLMQASALPGEF